MQRDDGDVCYGRQHGANEYPINGLVLKPEVGASEISFLADVFCCASALAYSRTGPPSNRSVVIVSTRVSHKFARIIVRAEGWSLWIVSEGKLEQAHAGETKLLAKSFYFGSDYTEVFSNERQLFQFSLQGLEKLRTRALYPLTPCRR